MQQAAGRTGSEMCTQLGAEFSRSSVAAGTPQSDSGGTLLHNSADPPWTDKHPLATARRRYGAFVVFFSCFEKKKKRHTHRDAYLVVTTFQAGLGCGSLTASTLDAIDAYETAVENNELSSSLIRMISRQAVQVYSDAFLSLVRKAEIGDPHAQLPLSICSDSFGTKEVWRNADSPEEGVMVRVQIVHWIAVVAHLTQMLVLRLGRSQFKVCPKSSWPRRLWPIKGEIVQTVATQTLVKIETAFQSCQTPNSECDETEASRDADTREEQQSERWSGKQPSSR